MWKVKTARKTKTTSWVSGFREYVAVGDAVFVPSNGNESTKPLVYVVEMLFLKGCVYGLLTGLRSRTVKRIGPKPWFETLHVVFVMIKHRKIDAKLLIVLRFEFSHDHVRSQTYFVGFMLGQHQRHAKNELEWKIVARFQGHLRNDSLNFCYVL